MQQLAAPSIFDLFLKLETDYLFFWLGAGGDFSNSLNYIFKTGKAVIFGNHKKVFSTIAISPFTLV